MGAGDDDVAPWLPDERALLADAVGKGIPVLGLCLGAQLLAAVLDRPVVQRLLGAGAPQTLRAIEVSRALLASARETLAQLSSPSTRVRAPFSPSRVAGSSRRCTRCTG